MAEVAADPHSGSTEWKSQQHMDNGLPLLPVTSPGAAHSLKPVPLTLELGPTSPNLTSAQYRKSRGVSEGLGGRVGCQSSPWVTLVTIPPGKAQEEPTTMVPPSQWLPIPHGRKWVQAHTWATIP